MGFDLINPYVSKILLAIQEGNSINQLSKKTGISYAYTHQWIKRLEDINAIEIEVGIHIKDDEFYRAYEEVAQTVLGRSIDLEDAYLLPNFAGMDYRFSRTDAVFIWTKGGYQIGRNREDYPIFIDVLEEDTEDWQNFFDQYGIDTTIEERRTGGDGIYYVLFPRDSFGTRWMENASVTPLEETVEWARQYEVNFQPALEMLDEMYDLELDVEYRERNVM